VQVLGGVFLVVASVGVTVGVGGLALSELVRILFAARRRPNVVIVRETWTGEASRDLAAANPSLR
jgi:hypothetical protein